MRILEDIKEQTKQTFGDKCLSLLYRVLGIIVVPLAFICLYGICYVFVKYRVIDYFNHKSTYFSIFIITIVIIICFIIIVSKWDKCKSLIHNNIVLFVLLLAYILFYHFWEDLIENHVVNKFLDKLEPNLLNDFIFYLAVSCCVFFCYFNRGKNIKQSTKLISVVIVLFWIYYRWISNRFCFISLKSCEYIKYVDIFPLYCISKLISLLLKEYRLDYYPRKERIIRDAPIGYFQEDELEREKFAKNAIESFFGIYPYSGAFTYGIDASWGAGKTSFMNLMKEQINLVPVDCIIINFNPWVFSVNKDIVAVFFDELSKKLKQYDYTLAKNIIDYSKLLTAFDTKETKIISSLIELNQTDNSLQEKKNSISDAIKRIGRRIFVFIDDLDRLDADELMEMMKLIRSSSNFPYMYFVVAYDKSYLVRCLEQKMDIRGTDFIEKIIQHEFHLPPCPSKTIRRLLFNYSVNSIDWFDGDDKNELEDYVINNEKNNNPLTVLSTIREVKRLVNHFVSSYSYVKGRINIIDLLLFELFKTKYPLVFSFFELKKNEILLLDNNKHYILYDGIINEIEKDIDNEKNRHFSFLDYIKIHHNEFNINDIDQQSIQIILESLFKQNDSSFKEGHPNRKFNDKDWFDSYINLTELESDISDKEFENVMKEDFNVIKTALDKWLLVKKTYSLHYHITNYKAQDKETHMKLIRCVFYYISHYQNINRKKIDDINFRLLEFNDTRTLTEDDRKYMVNVLKEYGYNTNICRYVGYLHRSRSEFLNPKFLNIEDLIDLQQFYFSKLLLSYENDSLQVLHGFRLLFGFDYNDRRCLEKRFNDGYYISLFNSMQEYAKKHAVDFLTHIIEEEEVLTGKYYVLEYARIIWGSWNDFYNSIIESNDQQSHEIEDFKCFFEAYKRNYYKKTRFTFISLLPIGMSLDENMD